MTQKSTNNESITIEQGNDVWKQWRRWATKSIPGKRSALYFLNANILGMKDLVPMTERAHYAMCLFAEGATGIPAIDDARVKIVLVPRGVGKSALVSKGLPLLRLLQHDDYSVGIANEKADLAEAFLASIKEEFEQNMLLRVLFPERVPDDFRSTTWKSDRIVIKRKKANPVSPSVLATGVGGTVTGVHLNMWLADDLISQNAAEAAYRGNFEEIEKVNRWLRRLEPLLKSPKGDPIVIIGTCWWEGDTYDFAWDHWGHGEETKQFDWTLQLPNGQTQSILLERKGEVARFKRPIYEGGTSFFPERLSDTALDVLREQDPIFFAGQYLLEPTAGAASLFDPSWLRPFDWDGDHTIVFRNEDGRPEHLQLRDLAIAISVDPAFSDKHSAARTAIPVVGVHGHRKFLLDLVARRGLETDAIAHVVADLIQRYSPRKVYVETIVAQVAVANAIRRVCRDRGLGEPPLEEISSHGRERKEWRIYGLEPYFKRGEFYHHAKSSFEFVREYQSFPRGQLRDILDALSFQRDFWERAASLVGKNRAHGQVSHPGDRSAIERIRNALRV